MSANTVVRKAMLAGWACGTVHSVRIVQIPRLHFCGAETRITLHGASRPCQPRTTRCETSIRGFWTIFAPQALFAVLISATLEWKKFETTMFFHCWGM